MQDWGEISLRPINKGAVPVDTNGNPIEFKKYQESRGFLIDRIGSYCSYCERRLAGNTAVEHVQPKSKRSDLELKWSNFLLACINCNSIKGHQDIDLSQYFWPDKDNTLIAFQYNEGAMISTNSRLTHHKQTIAKNTISLTGLDRVPSPDPHKNPEMSDTRWRERYDALNTAEEAKQTLINSDTESMRTIIVKLAVATGFFSIWLKVFSYDKNMIFRFLDAFPGTTKDCFNAEGLPVKRNGGAV
jgi:uncharacterized protein (TIGR02646 family)